MSKKDEALKLALEALEEAWYHVGTFQPTEKAIDLYDEARTALREALAEQPARVMKVEGPLHVVCQCDQCKSQQALDKKAENARELGLDYEPAQQEPVAWKLVPREPTHEMLKAMDECSTEGYDERLYAGHAASVYMAAVDAAPTPPAQRKPLTDEEIILIVADCASSHQHTDIHFARAIERAHGIKELV